MPAGWQVDIKGFRELSRILGAAASDVRSTYRSGLKEAVLPVAMEARRNASRFSSRIPGSIRPFVTASSVGVRAGGKRAPHARINELSGRHPVFGNRAVWVTQKKRPFLQPAAEAKADEIEKNMADAFDEMFGRAGFQ